MINGQFIIRVWNRHMISRTQYRLYCFIVCFSILHHLLVLVPAVLFYSFKIYTEVLFAYRDRRFRINHWKLCMILFFILRYIARFWSFLLGMEVQALNIWTLGDFLVSIYVVELAATLLHFLLGVIITGHLDATKV
jgi:hypothetical protein